MLDGLLLRNAGRRLCDQLLIDLDFARRLPQCLAPAGAQDDAQQEERPAALHWHNVLERRVRCQDDWEAHRDDGVLVR